MCVPLTPEDIKEFMPAATGVADSVLQLYIDMIASADPCLTGSGQNNATIKALKLNYIAHLVTMAGGVSGEVVSERSPTGESVQYAAPAAQGRGLAATSYGRMVQQLDLSGCFAALQKPSIVAYSVGR